MSHTCHARGCSTLVRPELLMCLRHWRQVPRTIQRAVWDSYRPGQCDDKRPSRTWLDAAGAAIGFVALGEHRSCTKGEARALIAFGYEQNLIDAFKTEKLREAARAVVEELKAEMK
jgi:hypothetical protein